MSSGLTRQRVTALFQSRNSAQSVLHGGVSARVCQLFVCGRVHAGRL